MATTATATTATNEEKPVMVIGLDDSNHSFYALEWILDHFFAPFAPKCPFKLIVIHAKPTPSSLVGLGGTGVHPEMFPALESDLKKIAHRVVDKAKQLCDDKSVDDVKLEIIEGDARNALCEAVDKYHASTLVVGSHGYGAIKRAGTWEHKRLLCAPCSLLCDDCEETQDQVLIL